LKELDWVKKQVPTKKKGKKKSSKKGRM